MKDAAEVVYEPSCDRLRCEGPDGWHEISSGFLPPVSTKMLPSLNFLTGVT